ncbi:MAG: hypothetical protein K6E92_01665 [Lachnospiraceae bacterium]|nr:hypothetical protein [Lachnospiraceae bacterium]
MQPEKEIKKEIRKALLGDLEPAGDGLVVAKSRLERLSYGVADGAGGVLFFGVMRQVRRYQVFDENHKQKLLKSARKAMQETGRRFYPETAPESLAIVRNYILTRPVVALFTVTDEYAQLAIYSARGISGLISTLRTRHSFESHMPEKSLKRIEYNPGKERAEEIAREREAARARKAEEEAQAVREQEMRLAEQQAYFAAQQQWMQQMQAYQMQQQAGAQPGAAQPGAAEPKAAQPGAEGQPPQMQGGMPTPPVPPAWMMQQMMQQGGMMQQMMQPGQNGQKKRFRFGRK